MRAYRTGCSGVNEWVRIAAVLPRECNYRHLVFRSARIVQPLFRPKCLGVFSGESAIALITHRRTGGYAGSGQAYFLPVALDSAI